MTIFDEHAEAYDGWFLRNRQVLESEVRLLARMLGEPGRALSVGCGSGLFESILRERGVSVRHGVEPSAGMAAIARKRGMEVEPGTAEALPFDDASFDTILLNGIPGYVADLLGAFREAFRVVRPGGRVVVADVPKESGYGLLYRLAVELGDWGHPDLVGAAPPAPYPIGFAATARWRTTAEKADLLRRAGFADLEFAQTLVRHPVLTNAAPENPTAGCDRGGYVAIRARRPT